MGVIEQEIAELRQMHRDYVAGRVSDDVVEKRLRIYIETEKRMRE